MKAFDPIEVVENSHLILDHGEWPNFHDAELHDLNIWRGDIRPDDNVWVGPIIKASFELCALEYPYIVVLKFHDCDSIRMQEFNHQNAVYDLAFKFEERGILRNGSPLSPHILVNFEQAFGVALTFKCFRVQAIERRKIEGIIYSSEKLRKPINGRMKMYKLYDFLRSGNCYKIRLLLHQLSIDYERVNIDILNKESRTLEFLKINPNGRVPVLNHKGKTLAESNAILWYLATDTDLLPEDKYQQALVLQWMFFEQFSHEPNIAAPRYWVSILKAENEYREKLQDKMKAGYAALDVMEQHLQKNMFFVADRYSIADIAFYAYTHVAEEGNFDLSGYDHIKAWFKRIEAQDSYINIKQN